MTSNKQKRRRQRRQRHGAVTAAALVLVAMASSSLPTATDASNTMVVQPSNLPRGAPLTGGAMRAVEGTTAGQQRGASGAGWLDNELKAHSDRKDQKAQIGVQTQQLELKRQQQIRSHPQIEYYPLESLKPRDELDITSSITDSTKPLGAPLESQPLGKRMNFDTGSNTYASSHVGNGPFGSSDGSSGTTTSSGTAGKQVILRPRPNYSTGNSLEGMNPVRLPLMGMGNGQINNGNPMQEGTELRVVYYYDELALKQSNPSGSTGQSNNFNSQGIRGENKVPELTLPEIVYDAHGHPMKLSELHDGGKNEVFLEVKPRNVWGNDWKSNLSSSLSIENWNEKLLSSLNTNARLSNVNKPSMTQSQDQMIVFFTVATMAIMVGALSARRLKNKKLLEHCMDPDLEEEEEDWEEEIERLDRMERYRLDKKEHYGGGESLAEESVGGLSSLMSGGRLGARRLGGSGGYESFGGNLHWRGDMEKFDV